jgi:hypothetical protein
MVLEYNYNFNKKITTKSNVYYEWNEKLHKIYINEQYSVKERIDYAVKLLTENDYVHPDYCYNYIMDDACEYSYNNIIKYLIINKCVDVNYNKDNAFAVYLNTDHETLKVFIKHGLNIENYRIYKYMYITLNYLNK